MKRILYLFSVLFLTTAIVTQAQNDAKKELQSAVKNNPDEIISKIQQFSGKSLDISDLKYQREVKKDNKVMPRTIGKPEIKEKSVSNIAQEVLDEANENFAKFLKAGYPCDKLTDTIIDYEWNGSAWVYDYMEVMSYNDMGYPTGYLGYSYDPQTKEWFLEDSAAVVITDGYPTAYTIYNWNETEEAFIPMMYMMVELNDDIQVTKMVSYSNYDIPTEEWLDRDSIVYTYGDNGYLASEFMAEITGGGSSYDTMHYYTYTYNASGYLVDKAFHTYNNDGDPRITDYWMYDIAGYEPNDRTTGWTFDNEGAEPWTLNKGNTSGLVSINYENWGFDAATDSFASGSYEEYTYMELEPYMYDEINVAYGDLIGSELYKDWDYETQDWVVDEKYYGYTYNEYALPTTYIWALPTGTDAWEDTVRYNYHWGDAYYSFDCNDILTGSDWDIYYKEIFTDSEEWLEVYRSEWGDFGEVLNYTATYDAAKDSLTSATKMIMEYDANSIYYDYIMIPFNGFLTYNPVYTEQYSLDYESQELYLSYDEVVELGNFYRFDNSFTSTYPTFWMERMWDPVEEQMDTLGIYAETTVNADGYPTYQMDNTLSYYGMGDGSALVTFFGFSGIEEKGYVTYNTDADVTDFVYMTIAEDTLGKEVLSYTADGDFSIDLTQDYVSSEFVNSERTVYDHETNPYAAITRTADQETFDAFEMYQAWNGVDEKWDTLNALIYGPDWEIPVGYSGGEWTLSEYLYGINDPEGNKGTMSNEWTRYRMTWDDVDELWETDEYFVFDFEDLGSSCGTHISYEEYGEANDDNTDFIPDYKIEKAYSCELEETYDSAYYEWDATAADWFMLEYYTKNFEQNSSCGYEVLPWEGYEWNDNAGVYVRNDGYDEEEVYNDDGLLIEDTYRSYYPGGSSGDHNMYTYDEDGYLIEEIYQYYDDDINAWVNSDRDVYIYSGTRPVTVTDLTITDVNCVGDSTGVLDIEVVGGDGEYTFAWSNGATTEDLNGVPEGVYEVTITDGNGCTFESPLAEVVTLQPMAMDITTSATDASSMYAIDGLAVANLEGGMAPFTYMWNDRLNTFTEETTARTDTMMYANPGSYKVVVTDALGCVAEELVYVNYTGATGVEDMLNNLGVAAYPNPVNGDLSVQVRDDFIGATVSVLRVNGQVVYSQEMNDNYNTIDMSAMDAGVYFLRTVAGEKVVTQKIIVE